MIKIGENAVHCHNDEENLFVIIDTDAEDGLVYTVGG